MRIPHYKAIELEAIVREVYNCDRGGMGGFIDADHFESSPFDAALIALAPLWRKLDFYSVEAFLIKWEGNLRNSNNEDCDIDNYIHELAIIVSKSVN